MSKASGAKSPAAAGAISSADANLEETAREDSVLSAADKSERRTQTIVSLASVVGALILWELVARFAIHDVAILPAPSAVFNVFVSHLTNEYPAESLTLPEHLLVSFLRISIGFVAGSIVGIAIGAAMSANKYIRYAVDPIIEMLRPLPPLAFIPLFVVWFGINEPPKLMLIFIGVVPVMIIATLSGLEGVPKQMLDAAASLGASRNYALVHVKIRAALASIVTGMRVAVGVSWTSIVAAEMIAADRGVGYVILEAGNYLDMAMVFSSIVLIGGTGLLMDRALRMLLRRLDPTRL